MTIQSHGYEVMSLDEIIDALTKIKEMSPELGDKPVWIENCPPLYWPVKAIWVGEKFIRSTGVYVVVERGGN